MNAKRALTGALVIVLLLASGAVVYWQFFRPSAETTAAQPTPDATTAARPVVDEGAVSAEGQIVPLRQAALAFSTSGEVAEFFVAEGEEVKAHQPILRLDDTEQRLAVERAEADSAAARASRDAAGANLEAARLTYEASALDVAAAEAQLALARGEPRPEEIALAEARLALAEAGVAQARAAQALVLEGVPDSRVRAAEAQLRAAEAQAIPARLRLEEERRREPADADALAQAERDYNAALAAIAAAQQAVDDLAGGATAAQQSAAASGVNAAAAQRDAATVELEQVQAGGRAEQIAVAEAALAAARAAEAEAQSRYLNADTAAAIAGAALQQAETAVMAAHLARNERTLLAPFDSTVADLVAVAGEVINAGMPAVILADFSAWQVETTDLTELDVAAVAIDAPARVRVDALPGVELGGVVTAIAPIASEVRGDTTYRVTIRLDDAPDVPLRWGMTVFTSFGEDGPAGAAAATETASTARAEGQLLPERSAVLSFQVPGRVAAPVVAEGESVTEGALLIFLENAELTAAVLQAEAGLAAAEAAHEAARTEVILAQQRQTTAETGVATAEAQLALAQAGARPEQLAAAERGVAAARANLNRATAERDAALAVSDAAVGAARAELAAAEARLTALQESYDTILTTCVTLPDGSEVCPLLGAPEENARAQVAAAEAVYSAAQLALAEAQAGATAAERSAASAGVAVAAAELAVAEAQRDVLAAGLRPEEIRLAEIDVERAEAALTTAGVAIDAANAAMTRAEAGVTAATSALAQARNVADRLSLQAPFAGTVAEALVEQGEWIVPGTPVMRLGGGDWVVETTDLVELDVANIAVGREATVTFDALPGETLRGTVVAIGRVPEIALGDVTYRVRIALDEVPDDLPLRWGMTAQVTIDAP